MNEYCLMKIDTRTVSELGKDTSKVDFPPYLSKRLCGVAFATYHNWEHAECSSSVETTYHPVTRTVIDLTGRRMGSHMVLFKNGNGSFDCRLQPVVLLVTILLTCEKRFYCSNINDDSQLKWMYEGNVECREQLTKSFDHCECNHILIMVWE